MSSSQLPCQVKSTKWKTLSLALTGFDMSTKYFIVTTTKPYVCAIPDTKQNYVYSVIALWLVVTGEPASVPRTWTLGCTKKTKSSSNPLIFFSELCLAQRNSNLLEFFNLVKICSLANHFCDDQFLLYMFTSAPTVEPAQTCIHHYKLFILNIF